MNRPRRCITMAIVAMALLASGCFHREFHDGTAIYSFAWWVPAGALVVGIASVSGGWWLRHWGHRAGGRVWIACVMLILWGAMLLLIFVPGTYLDRVIVDEHHFETKYGLWWSPRHRSVRFDDLVAIRVVGEKSQNARNPGRVDHTLVCLHKAGNQEELPVGDVVGAGLSEIITRARAKGVVVLMMARPRR